MKTNVIKKLKKEYLDWKISKHPEERYWKTSKSASKRRLYAGFYKDYGFLKTDKDPYNRIYYAILSGNYKPLWTDIDVRNSRIFLPRKGRHNNNFDRD